MNQLKFCTFITLILYSVVGFLGQSNAKKSKDDICQLSAIVGPCVLSWTNFFYNVSTEECESFIYSGCEGNDNRFWSKDICTKVCKEGNIEYKPKKCFQPVDLERYKGRHNHTETFYFNSKNNKCDRFNWTGEAIDNRFEMPTQCEEECIGHCVDYCPAGPQKKTIDPFLESLNSFF